MKRNLVALMLICTCLVLAPFPARAEESIPKLVKRVQPAVVTIFTFDKSGKPTGQGSGFFVDKQGLLITNRHVLEGAAHALVETQLGERYQVSMVIAESRNADIILLKLASSNRLFPSLKITGLVPEVGEKVVVIGSPLGLEQTVSDGVVSAVRNIPSFGEILQISAPISQGSSGGPVVNLKGKVIGVATFQLMGGQNLNFAIPGYRVLALKPAKGKTFVQWAKDATKELVSNYSNMGLALMNQGRLKEAVAAYEKVIQIKPDNDNAYLILGGLYFVLYHYQKAIWAFTQVIRLKPNDRMAAYAYNGLGCSYNELGRNMEALFAFREAIRIKPDYEEAKRELEKTLLIIESKGIK